MAKEKRHNTESPLSACLPFGYMHDEHTIGLKHPAFLRVIKVQGMHGSVTPNEVLEDSHLRRNQLLKDIGIPQLTLYTHSVKRRVSLAQGGDYPKGFALKLHQAWQQKLASADLFVTEHFVSPVVDCEVGAQKQFKRFFRSLAPSTFAQDLAYAKERALKQLKVVSERIERRLDDRYNARLLGSLDSEHGQYSEPVSTMGLLVNGRYQRLALPNMPLSPYLANVRPLFLGETIELRYPSATKYAAIFSIKEYPAKTPKNCLEPLFQLHHEMVVTQAFSFMSKAKVKYLIKQEATNLVQSEDLSISQQEELVQAVDDLDSDRIKMGKYHFTVMVMADTPQGLADAVRDVDHALGEANISAIREDANLENAYLAQFPGNLRFACRRRPLTTMNYAGTAAFQGEAQGRATNNRWGDAITYLPTTNGGAFAFNFHLADQQKDIHAGIDDNNPNVTDKAHTSVIGVNGSGKTLTVNFLLAMAQKIRPRLIYFDKDRASEIFVRALGGVYSAITPSQMSGLNPLQLPDTAENRVFLERWFEALLTANGEKLSAEDRIDIKEAITANYETMEPMQRRLRYLAPFFASRTGSDLYERLSLWHGNGSRAYLFDNEIDAFSFSERVIGVDLSHLLKDEVSQFPTIFYLFHRLQESLDGTPTLIPFDEGWAFLRNPHFEDEIETLLKTIRKKEGMVIFMTQNPSETAKSRICASLVDEIATHIFFPNDTANKAHYCDVYKLNDKEYQFIREADVSERQMLIKQGKQSVIATVDLKGMTDFIPILSGRKKNIEVLQQIISQDGDDVDTWLPRFLKEATA